MFFKCKENVSALKLSTLCQLSATVNYIKEFNNGDNMQNSYEAKTQNLQKLSKRHEKKLSNKQKTVFIRDLVVRTPIGNYGEFRTPKPYDYGKKERIIDHIQFLLLFANCDHRSRNYTESNQNKFKIKKGKENLLFP